MAPRQTSITTQNSLRNGRPKITRDLLPSSTSITRKLAVYYNGGKWIDMSLIVPKGFLLDPSPRVTTPGHGCSFPKFKSFAK